jgi:hypothetical protein
LIFVIAGPPGVGKSRATVALAQAGASGENWFGLQVHCRFKTMILQNKNGMFRLSQELANLDSRKLDEWVRISPPPPAGLCFDRPEFRSTLAREIAKFRPDLVLLDPWNAVARDEKVIQPVYVIKPFSPAATVTLIIVTAATGYAFGFIGAAIWNKLHRAK